MYKAIAFVLFFLLCSCSQQVNEQKESCNYIEKNKDEIHLLITLLSSETWSERNKAETTLIELGLDIVTLLRDWKSFSDPNLKQSCEKIIKKVLLAESDYAQMDKLEIKPEKITCFALSFDGQYLAYGDAAGNINIWSVSESKHVRSFKSKTSRIDYLFFGPECGSIVSFDEAGELKKWDISKGSLLLEKEGFWYVCAAPGLNWFIAVSANSERISIYDFDTFESKDELYIDNNETLSRIILSPDGRKLAIGVYKHPRNSITWNNIYTKTVHIDKGLKLHLNEKVYDKSEPWFFSNDGEILCLQNVFGLELINALENKSLMKVNHGLGLIFHAALIANNHILITATGGYNGMGIMNFWNVSTGKIIRTLEDLEMVSIKGLAVSLEGKVLVALSIEDSIIRIWQKINN